MLPKPKFLYLRHILPKKGNKKGNGIIIAGSTDILSTLATCCNPVYGEDIVGYITRGYGVKIHSKNCPNIDLSSERIIEAKWDLDEDNGCGFSLQPQMGSLFEDQWKIERRNEMYYKRS